MISGAKVFRRKERKELERAGLPDKEEVILRLELINAERARKERERSELSEREQELRELAVDDDDKITETALVRIQRERTEAELSDIRDEESHWKGIEWRLTYGSWKRDYGY